MNSKVWIVLFTPAFCVLTAMLAIALTYGPEYLKAGQLPSVDSGTCLFWLLLAGLLGIVLGNPVILYLHDRVRRPLVRWTLYALLAFVATYLIGFSFQNSATMLLFATGIFAFRAAWGWLDGRVRG